MKKRTILKTILVICFYLITLCSCARVNINLTQFNKPVCMNLGNQLNAIVLKHFKDSTSADYGLFGLICWSPLNIKEIVSKEIAKNHGDGVINLTIKGYYSVWQAMFGIITAPFWLHKTYIIEGDVIALPKKNNPPPF